MQQLSVLTEASGDYRLDIHATGERGESGSYVVEIDQARLALATDRHRVTAERLYAEAYRHRFEGAGESLRTATAIYSQALEAWRLVEDPVE